MVFGGIIFCNVQCLLWTQYRVGNCRIPRVIPVPFFNRSWRMEAEPDHLFWAKETAVITQVVGNEWSTWHRCEFKEGEGSLVFKWGLGSSASVEITLRIYLLRFTSPVLQRCIFWKGWAGSMGGAMAGLCCCFKYYLNWHELLESDIRRGTVLCRAAEAV